MRFAKETPKGFGSPTPAGEGPRRRSALGRPALVASAALLLGWAASGCASEPARQDAAVTEQADGPVQTVEGMTLRESENGRLRWVLFADSTLVYETDDLTLLKELRVDFYDATGREVSSVLRAREGRVDPRTHAIVARRDVVVVSSEGHRLETEELRWDPERGQVISDCFVRLTKGESVLTGMGIESDPELKSYAIRSQVQGELREEDRIFDDEF